MALLTVSQISLAGIVAPTPAAASAGGDTFVNNGQTFLVCNNASAAAITVTIDSLVNCDEGFDHNVVVPSVIADVDTVLLSTNMKVGTYTIDAQPLMPRALSVTRTVVGDPDTPGTVTIVGIGPDGATVTEVFAVGAHNTPVLGTKIFAAVTTITGAGWVIATANDTITVGEQGLETWIGPFSMNRFNNSQGIVTATYSTHTDLTVAAVSL